jgi:hypothetical protein
LGSIAIPAEMDGFRFKGYYTAINGGRQIIDESGNLYNSTLLYLASPQGRGINNLFAQWEAVSQEVSTEVTPVITPPATSESAEVTPVITPPANIGISGGSASNNTAEDTGGTD